MVEKREGKIEVELHGPIAGEVVEFLCNYAVFLDNEMCTRKAEDKGDGWVSVEFERDTMEILLAGFREISGLAVKICDYLYEKGERGDFLAE